MKTLKLFNAVLAKDSNKLEQVFVSDLGFIIHPNALWAKNEILDYYQRETLNGNDLNKTFHKSWAKIKNSSRFELLIDQILHYMSTYGSDFQDEIYIPNEILELPDVTLKYKVIKAYTKDELIKKSLGLLQSGIALKSETINDIFDLLLNDLNYKFTGNENIRNKEAIVKLADDFGIFPKDTVEFFRYIIYKATGETLLIKNKKLISLIKNSSYNPSKQFNMFGLKKLSEIFNRFKPLFLAFKNKDGKSINKISKLSKKYHKPLVENPLNSVTSKMLKNKDIPWLSNATPYALFKALQACHTRINGQDSFVYRIRNGKSWIVDKDGEMSLKASEYNMKIILDFLKVNYDFSDKKIFLPKDIYYALPTSEKMFVGNIPTGTKIVAPKMAVGVYWEDKWGARDLDLSGMNIGGKIGWNSSYNQGNGDLMFSGDITSAPNGAVEYLYANRGLLTPTLVLNNVYSGDPNSGFKIIVGAGDDINKNYMMNPDKLIFEVKTESVQKQTIVGLFMPYGSKQSFTLLNFGAGNSHISGYDAKSNTATKALYQQWNNPYNLNSLLKELNAVIVENVEDADINLSVDNLEKDTFVNLFS